MTAPEQCTIKIFIQLYQFVFVYSLLAAVIGIAHSTSSHESRNRTIFSEKMIWFFVVILVSLCPSLSLSLGVYLHGAAQRQWKCYNFLLRRAIIVFLSVIMGRTSAIHCIYNAKHKYPYSFVEHLLLLFY